MASYAEDFVKADAATLGPLLTWTETSGTSWGVTGNLATVQATGSGGVARAEHDCATPNMFATFTLSSFTGPSSVAYFGLLIRYNPAAQTFLQFDCLAFPGGSGDTFRLLRTVNGTESAVLGSYAATPTALDVLRIEANAADEVRCYLNGTLRIGPFAETVVTAAAGFKRAGISGLANAVGDVVSGNSFSFGDLAAVGSAGRVVNRTPIRSFVTGGLTA